MPASPEMMSPEMLPPPVVPEAMPAPKQTTEGIGSVAMAGVYRSTGNLEQGPELVDVEPVATPPAREPETELKAVGMARVVYDDEAVPDKGFTVRKVSYQEKQDYILRRKEELSAARARATLEWIMNAGDETKDDDTVPSGKRKKDKPASDGTPSDLFAPPK